MLLPTALSLSRLDKSQKNSLHKKLCNGRTRQGTGCLLKNVKINRDELQLFAPRRKTPGNTMRPSMTDLRL